MLVQEAKSFGIMLTDYPEYSGQPGPRAYSSFHYTGVIEGSTLAFDCTSAGFVTRLLWFIILWGFLSESIILQSVFSILRCRFPDKSRISDVSFGQYNCKIHRLKISFSTLIHLNFLDSYWEVYKFPPSTARMGQSVHLLVLCGDVFGSRAKTWPWGFLTHNSENEILQNRDTVTFRMPRMRLFWGYQSSYHELECREETTLNLLREDWLYSPKATVRKTLQSVNPS